MGLIRAVLVLLGSNVPAAINSPRRSADDANSSFQLTVAVQWRPDAGRWDPREPGAEDGTMVSSMQLSGMISASSFMFFWLFAGSRA